MAMSDVCDFQGLLARFQVRATPLRLAVLEALGSASRALRAKEILMHIKDQRRVNKVTVYRILEDFSRRGLIRRIPAEGKAALYELACEHNPPHPHFQCQTCGAVECLEPVSLTRVWDEIRGPLGHRADRLEIRVAGLCRRCRGRGGEQ
ncbi:MAG: transcriptional repressor [Deltaproteobacteria bacterium]|nr:transcriptional repressor [Deltaproteobacteria bacterium]